MKDSLSKYQSAVDSISSTIEAIRNIKKKYGRDWPKKSAEHLDLWQNHLHKLSGDTMTNLVEMMKQIQSDRPDLINDKFKSYIKGCAEIIHDHSISPKMNVKGTRPLDNVLDTDVHSYQDKTYRKWMFVFIMELYDLFIMIDSDSVYNKMHQQTVFRKLFEMRHGKE